MPMNSFQLLQNPLPFKGRARVGMGYVRKQVYRHSDPTVSPPPPPPLVGGGVV